eukprot:scaffold152984_cov35-Tisochrysis_lutea.AAC.3
MVELDRGDRFEEIPAALHKRKRIESETRLDARRHWGERCEVRWGFVASGYRKNRLKLPGQESAAQGTYCQRTQACDPHITRRLLRCIAHCLEEGGDTALVSEVCCRTCMPATNAPDTAVIPMSPASAWIREAYGARDATTPPGDRG